MPKRYFAYGKLFLVFLWLALTLSLAAWWMFFALNLVDQTAGNVAELSRQRFMLTLEGITWMILLLGGGVTLVVYVIRERRQNQQIREFVAAFSHDLKTALASMRLQAESLREDLQGSGNQGVVERLAADTVRLQIQLENSLYLASTREQKLFLEELDLSQVVEKLKLQWPQMKIRLHGQAIVKADQRALESIISNILHNSAVHGQANCVDIELMSQGSKEVALNFSDDGLGFKGSRQHLGDLFYRQNPSSGSGVGLYIVSNLLRKMGGHLRFPRQDRGFTAQVNLEGQVR